MKRRSFLAFLLLLALVSLTAGDYTFRQIDLSVKVGPDNSYDVTERIVAEFFVPKHGIFREIPIRTGISGSAEFQRATDQWRRVLGWATFGW